MQFADYNTAKLHLLLVFNTVAPDGATQRKMVETVHKMEEADESYASVILCITEAISAGMRWGNW